MNYFFTILTIFLCFSINADNLNKKPVDPSNKKEDVSESNVSQYDFRKTNWGMSRDQVGATEGSSKLIAKGIDGFFYATKVAGFDMHLIYHFIDDKLVSASYATDEKHSNYNEYLNDFFKIEQILKKKYRNPTTKENRWRNDTFKESSNDYGMAIALGQ